LLVALVWAAGAAGCNDAARGLSTRAQAARVEDAPKDHPHAERRRLECRLAQIGARRAPLLGEALALLGASKDDRVRAERLLVEDAREICAASPKRSARKDLSRLLDGLQADFVAAVPFLRDVPGVLLDVLFDRIGRMQDRCFRGQSGLDAATLANLDDKTFGARLDDLALGACGGANGGLVDPMAPGAGSFHACVADALRARVDQGRAGCNLAGGVDVGEVESEVPEPPPTGGVEIGEVETEVPAEGHVAVGPIETEVATEALGAASVVVEVALDEIEISSPSSLGAKHDVGGWSARLIEAAKPRLGGKTLCPAVLTAAGPLLFAGAAGQDASRRALSYSNILGACACSTARDDLTDPGGQLGSTCGGDRTSRLSCLRDPNDETGRPRRECAQMLAEDNKLLLDARARACFVTACGDDRVVGADCACVSLGGGGGGGVDPCKTIACPPGTLPVPSGLTCRCEQSAVGPGPGPGL
jgi:hypothetical protein